MNTIDDMLKIILPHTEVNDSFLKILCTNYTDNKNLEMEKTHLVAFELPSTLI